ncbi:uncharacterized protein LOC141534073 [Cotesia typhae]
MMQLNRTLQAEVIQGNREIMGYLKSIDGNDLNFGPKIGDANDKNQIFLGDDEWITRTFYEALMGAKLPNFIEQLADHIFGRDVLLKSTVTGKPSNRSKNAPPEVKQLDPHLLQRMRGMFKHWLYTSVHACSLTTLKKDQLLGKLEWYLGRMIAGIKTKNQSTTNATGGVTRDHDVDGEEGTIGVIDKGTLDVDTGDGDGSDDGVDDEENNENLDVGAEGKDTGVTMIGSDESSDEQDDDEDERELDCLCEDNVDDENTDDENVESSESDDPDKLVIVDQ